MKKASLLCILSAIVLIATQNIPPRSSVLAASSTVIRGVSGDTWADIVLGQPDFSEGSIKEKVSYKVNNPGGTIIDRNHTPNRLFVSDAGNSRVLGYLSLGVCQANQNACTTNADCPGSVCQLTPNKPADIVIGQPDFTKSACNGDSGYQNYPTHAQPTANTLCSMPESQVSPLEGGFFASMATDSQGNLYYPDWLNNRILKYTDPFGTDRTADAVWGQPNFTSRNCNQTSSTSLCLGPADLSTPNSFETGVDIDSQNNLWVADTTNNRVVRFPFDNTTNQPSATADIVLGQPNMTTSTSGNSLNQLSGPSAVRVDASGNVYVADTRNNRVLIYTSPSTGATAALWGSGFDHPTGIEIDPINNGIWVNDTLDHKIELWDTLGTQIQKILYTDLPTSPTLTGSCSSTVGVCYQHDSRGSIGITSSGDMWIASSAGNQDVVRFSGPIPTPQAGVIPAADFRLFNPPDGHNLLSAKSVQDARGITIANNQVIITDAYRVLFWNDPASLTSGKPADGVVGPANFSTTDPNNYGRLKADKSGHLFVMHRLNIEIYNLPLTTGATPIKVLPTQLKNLENQTVDILQNGDLIVGGIFPSPDGSSVWLANNFSHRVIRIKNPLTTPVVDIILGQTSPSQTSCNQGLAQPTMSTLCAPGAVTLDRNNNLYVTDNSLEVTGNGRILEYDAANIPSSPTQTRYAIPANRVISSKHTFEPAFNSRNEMVIGYNTYAYQNNKHSLDYILNPLVSATPSGSFSDFYSMPYSMDFDNNDNLYVTDLNRWHVMIYKNPLTAPASPTPSPVLTPTTVPSSPTPTLTPTPTPIQTTSTFGNTSIGGSTDSNDSNILNGSKFQTGNITKTILSASVYIRSIDSQTANRNYQLAVYTDLSGKPNQLVTKSSTNTLLANAWNTASLSGTLQPNKTYWIIYNTNGRSKSVNNMVYKTGSSAGISSNSKVNFNTWPTTFPGSTKNNQLFSIYLTVK